MFFLNKSKLTEINSPTGHPHKENIKLETCPEGLTLALDFLLRPSYKKTNLGP